MCKPLRHPHGPQKGRPQAVWPLASWLLCGFSAWYVHGPILQMGTLSLRRTRPCLVLCTVIFPAHCGRWGLGVGAPEMSERVFLMTGAALDRTMVCGQAVGGHSPEVTQTGCGPCLLLGMRRVTARPGGRSTAWVLLRVPPFCTEMGSFDCPVRQNE